MFCDFQALTMTVSANGNIGRDITVLIIQVGDIRLRSFVDYYQWQYLSVYHTHTGRVAFRYLTN